MYHCPPGVLVGALVAGEVGAFVWVGLVVAAPDIEMVPGACLMDFPYRKK